MAFSAKTFRLFILLVLLHAKAFSQETVPVRGKVVDGQTGKPIAGATISVSGTSASTSSAGDGSFAFSSVQKNAVLVASFLGYQSQRLPAGGFVEFRLTPSSSALEDVVVIGYGSVRRRDVTAAISSVSVEDVNERPIVSTGQLIQGRSAGVSVVRPNGAPGGETSVRIRGTTSLNGSNAPLYVVDGVPVDNLNFLSPTDIADMQILKDASSAAVYGSRAANGVVLISTKQGRPGDAKIALNAQNTQRHISGRMEALNAQQYKELQDEIGLVNLPDGLPDRTDWFYETFKTGQLQQYQLSVSDGTEKSRYFLSSGYLNEKGIIGTAFYKRYNFRANTENKVRNWLTLSTNLAYSDYNGNGIITGQGANRGGVVTSVINTPTYAPIWDENNPGQYHVDFYGVNITHPIENMARTQNNQNRENRLVGSASAAVRFSPVLNFRTSLALDRRNGLSTTFLDPLSTSWGRNQYGEGSDARNTNTVLTFDNVLTYNPSFGRHNLEAMGGTSWTTSDYRSSQIIGSHYRNDLIRTLNAANKISWMGTGSGASQWAILSYFGRASYHFDSKYLATFNMRADGSSKLHPDHRWGLFSSLSVAWRLSAEGFLADADWLDDLKIRAGSGETGNQSGVGDYAYLQRYGIRRIEWFVSGQENALPTISQTNLRTRDLTWETTRQTNVGIDLSAFGNRLNINLDYYHKRTRDMLVNVELPAGAAPVSNIVRNEGVMSNRGFEVNINSKNLSGSLAWNSDFNISFNRNRLEELRFQKIYNAARTTDFMNEFLVRNEPGRPLGGFYGYISDGVDPATGELMYRDVNGDGRITPTDKMYIGDPNPDFTFGMTNTLGHKGFHLSVFVQGAYGNDVYNASRIETEGMYDGKNQSVRVLDRWRAPGQQTDVPKAGFDLKNSNYFVEDGSFLRLKNISLAYDVPTAGLSRLGLRKLQPFVSLANILTWTKYSGFDPEVNEWGENGAVQGIDWGTYPHSRSFVAGINVEF